MQSIPASSERSSSYPGRSDQKFTHTSFPIISPWQKFMRSSVTFLYGELNPGLSGSFRIMKDFLKAEYASHYTI